MKVHTHLGVNDYYGLWSPQSHSHFTRLSRRSFHSWDLDKFTLSGDSKDANTPPKDSHTQTRPYPCPSVG